MSAYPRLPDDAYGCTPCASRWSGTRTECWCCGNPGESMPPAYISVGGSVPFGMNEELRAARRNGPVLSDDPCGGGAIT